MTRPALPEVTSLLDTNSIFDPAGEPRLELLRTRPRAYLGLDLGQAQDHAAIVVLQRLELLFRNRRDPVTYQPEQATLLLVRYAERIPLGLSYPAVAAHVAALAIRPEMKDTGQIVVDATGVGAPVVDLLRAKSGLRSRIVPVVITPGDHESERDGRWYVPKRDLMAGLRIAFEGRSIAITGQGETTTELANELVSMRLRRSESGTERIAGKHKDDLAMALALAWWRAAREAGRT